MNYFDVFLPGTWTEVEPEPDTPNGVHLDGPGPKRAIVYACHPLNSGLLHCLVTGEQQDQLDADHIAYVTFSAIPAGDKGQGGGPAHVFGYAVFEYDEGQWKMYKPGSGEPLVLAEAEAVAMEAIR